VIATWLDGFPGGRRSGVLVLAVLAVAIAYTTIHAPFGADYARPDCDCDDPGYSIKALAHGHVGRAIELQPLMGPVSIVLRAPFAAVAYATGGTDEDAYELGLIPCLLAIAALGAYLIRRLSDRTVNEVAAPALAFLLIFNPGVTRAIHFGHPEEFLAGALCVAGVMLALRDRPVWSGVLIALAFATKQWALVGIFVALAVNPRAWLRLGVAFAGVSLLLFLPAAVVEPAHFKELWIHGGQKLDTRTGGSAAPTNVWWAFAEYSGTRSSGLPRWVLPGWTEQVAHPSIIVSGIVLSALWALGRRRVDRGEALLLLALVLLLRCMLDPLTNSYYHLPFVLAVAAYELDVRRRIPFAAIVAGLALYANVQLAAHVDADGLNHVYLAWTLPALGLLLYRVYRPMARPGRPAIRRSRASSSLVGSP
jgi:hypothetical protein